MVVHDIARPDVNGVLPKMHGICEQAKKELIGLAPYLSITTDDNLCSSVNISGSFDAKETWSNGIYQNSRYFRFSLSPMKGKRYYDAIDEKIEVELSNCSYKNSIKFRKYTGPVDKVLEKVKTWIKTGVNNG